MIMTTRKPDCSWGYGALSWLRKGVFCAILLWAVPLHAQPVTIAALGDSLTQGYGLPDGDGLVPQLQRYLDAAGEEVTLINAGVSGDTTAGGLARIGWTLGDDIDALIVTLGGNDVLRGIAPEVARANLDGILGAAGALPVLLIGIEAPGNYGPDYKRDFEAIYPDLSDKYGTLLIQNFFDALQDDSGAIGNARDFMQSDGIHPNANGVARIVNRMGPVVQELIAKARSRQD